MPKTERAAEKRIAYAVRQFEKRIIPRLAKDTKRYRDRTPEAAVAHIAKHDPTPNKKYLVWLTSNYCNGEIKRLEDMHRTGILLEVYERLQSRGYFTRHPEKNEFSDIGRLSPREMMDFVGSIDVDAEQSKTEIARGLEEKLINSRAAKIYHDDENTKVVRIYTHEASLHFGKNTQWCTASDDDAETFYSYIRTTEWTRLNLGDNTAITPHLRSNMWGEYVSPLWDTPLSLAERGKTRTIAALVIVLDKKANARWQFCLPLDALESEFHAMDERDNEITDWTVPSLVTAVRVLQAQKQFCRKRLFPFDALLAATEIATEGDLLAFIHRHQFSDEMLYDDDYDITATLDKIPELTSVELVNWLLDNGIIGESDIASRNISDAVLLTLMDRNYPLGTSYPDAERHIAAFISQHSHRTIEIANLYPTLVSDATLDAYLAKNPDDIVELNKNIATEARWIAALSRSPWFRDTCPFKSREIDMACLRGYLKSTLKLKAGQINSIMTTADSATLVYKPTVTEMKSRASNRARGAPYQPIFQQRSE